MPNRNIAPPLSTLAVPTLLPYRKKLLPNGIEVVYIHDPAQEVFKIDIVFEAGVYYQSRPLVASTALNMLNEGTRQHTAEQIADLFDYYGAYVDYHSGLNKSEINLISLSKYAPETLGMLSEIIRESVIPEKEFEIYLTNKCQEFLVNNEKTSYLARKEFSALLFGKEHPYANQVEAADFTDLPIESVREFYRQFINARRCRIMVCGRVDDRLLQIITEKFSGLSHPDGPVSSPAYAFRPAPSGHYHVDKENAVQTSLRIGKSGIRLTDDDYAGFMLLNTVLGGYFGSRLMSNIREEKGYTYGISSFNVSMPLSSYWCIGTDVNREYTQATIDETLKEIKKLQTELIPEDELILVKNYLHGDLLREVDGVFSQSDALKHKLNYGLDNRIYADIIHKITHYKAEDLMQLAIRYWPTDELYIVTAGEK